jgi:DNA-binding response OmpR family regulator
LAAGILVVEDEPGIAHFIRQGLSEAGYAVDVTLDGQKVGETTL